MQAAANERDWHGDIEFSILEADEEHVRAVMPVKPGILNPLGMVHAGAMIWFADVAATRLAIGKAEIGGDGKGFQLAIDLHAALVGNERDGELVAEARFVRRGKRVSVVRTRVTGTDGKLLLDMTTTHLPSG